MLGRRREEREGKKRGGGCDDALFRTLFYAHFCLSFASRAMHCRSIRLVSFPLRACIRICQITIKGQERTGMGWKKRPLLFGLHCLLLLNERDCVLFSKNKLHDIIYRGRACKV